MKKIFTIVFLFLLSQVQAQFQTVCDEGVSLPLNINFSGFIIFEDDTTTTNQGITPFNSGQQIRIRISQDEVSGFSFHTEVYTREILETGFFSFDIEDLDMDVANRINQNRDKSYFINMELRRPDGSWKLVGSKEILTVPYAQVANALGGIGEVGDPGLEGIIGPQGPVGAQGPQGAQGLQGQSGRDGPSDFGRLLMRDNEPQGNISYYVDDGSNTADGKPRLRFKHNGIWIDL